MGVSYDSGNSRFTITTDEVSVAEMITEKGTALSESDTTYVYSDGILGVQDGETMIGSLYVGKNASDVKSSGTLKSYGGGALDIPASGNFEIVKDYGRWETSATDSTDTFDVDAQQCTNDIKINGGIALEHVNIENIKSLGTVDISDITGYMIYPVFSGYNSAVFYITGLPGDGFYSRSTNLGKAIPGIYTEDGYPDIDLLSDVEIREAYPVRPAGFSTMSVIGKRSGTITEGSIGVGQVKMLLEPTGSANQQVKLDLEYIHTERLPFLFVLTSHNDTAIPNDIIMRGRITEALHPLDTWDMRTFELTVLEDA